MPTTKALQTQLGLPAGAGSFGFKWTDAPGTTIATFGVSLFQIKTAAPFYGAAVHTVTN